MKWKEPDMIERYEQKQVGRRDKTPLVDKLAGQLTDAEERIADLERKLAEFADLERKLAECEQRKREVSAERDENLQWLLRIATASHYQSGVLVDHACNYITDLERKLAEHPRIVANRYCCCCGKVVATEAGEQE